MTIIASDLYFSSILDLKPKVQIVLHFCSHVLRNAYLTFFSAGVLFHDYLSKSLRLQQNSKNFMVK